MTFVKYIFLLLDANPTEAEKEVFEVIREVLSLAPEILRELEQYKGASEEIRDVSIFFILPNTATCDFADSTCKSSVATYPRNK